MMEPSTNQPILQPGEMENPGDQALRGLSQDEVQKLFQQYGPNTIPEQKKSYMAGLPKKNVGAGSLDVGSQHCT